MRALMVIWVSSRGFSVVCVLSYLRCVHTYLCLESKWVLYRRRLDTEVIPWSGDIHMKACLLFAAVWGDLIFSFSTRFYMHKVSLIDEFTSTIIGNDASVSRMQVGKIYLRSCLKSRVPDFGMDDMI